MIVMAGGAPNVVELIVFRLTTQHGMGCPVLTC